MTEIKLHTYGEKLIVSEKVTLASGNINSAELHVTVDEAWAAYTNYSAIFETKEYVEPVERLMEAKSVTEYVCVIPSEVLQHQGTLEIGIRGITNDGEMAKTSSIAKYNIVKGASPGNITLNPTMDMYQQYLAAMDSKAAPLFEAYKEEIQAEHEKNMQIMFEEYSRFRAVMTETLEPVVLWTNPEPDNEDTFDRDVGDVKIDLDLSRFKYYVIVCMENASYSTPTLLHSRFLSVGEQGSIQATTEKAGETIFVVRSFTLETDGVTFSAGGTFFYDRSGVLAVPYQIVGYTPIVE